MSPSPDRRDIVRERYDVRFEPLRPVSRPHVGLRALGAPLMWGFALWTAFLFLADGPVLPTLAAVAAGGFAVGGIGLLVGAAIHWHGR